MTEVTIENPKLQSEEPPMPRICEVLVNLNDAGKLTVKQLEHALGLASRSGYRYYTREALDAQQLRQLFLASKSAPVQRALLEFLTEDTSWQTEYLDPKLDLNGDGDVNADDITDTLITMMETTTTTLRTARTEKSTTRHIAPQTAEQLKAQLAQIIQYAQAARQVVPILCPRSSNGTARM